MLVYLYLFCLVVVCAAGGLLWGRGALWLACVFALMAFYIVRLIADLIRHPRPLWPRR